MDLENEDLGATTPGSEGASVQSDPRENAQASEKPKDLKGQLKAAVAEHKSPSPARQAAAQQRAREETGRFSSTSSKDNNAAVDDRGTSASQPQASTVSSDGKQPVSQPATASQASIVEAPAALSKDVRAIWSTLPAQVQAEFVRRENDSTEGVKKLQDRYRPIEEALAPVRPLLQQRGMTEGQTVKQLLDWHHALSGPNKAHAFRALAQSHNFDLSTLASQQAGASQESHDPNQSLHPVLQQIASRTETLEQTLHRQQQDRIGGEIAAFSKDKPHFEKVRTAMGQMMSSGFATSLDDAYNKAIWADADVRTAIQQEEQAAREKKTAEAEDAKRAEAARVEEERKRKEAEDLAKARKAGVSPRGSAPTGVMAIAKNQQGKTVGSTIRDAIASRSGVI